MNDILLACIPVRDDDVEMRCVRTRLPLKRSPPDHPSRRRWLKFYCSMMIKESPLREQHTAYSFAHWRHMVYTRSTSIPGRTKLAGTSKTEMSSIHGQPQHKWQ